MFRGFETPATTSNSGETGNPAGIFVQGRNNRRNSSFQSGFPLGTPRADNFGTGGDRGFSFGGPQLGGYGSPQSQQPANYLNTENVVMGEWSSDTESRESVLETDSSQSEAEIEAQFREANEQWEQLNLLFNRRRDELQRSAAGSTGPQMGAYGSLQTQQPAHYLNTENVETEEWSSGEVSRDSTLVDLQFETEQIDRAMSLLTRYAVESARIFARGMEHLDELHSESMRRMLDEFKAELNRQPTRARGEGRRRNAASDGQHYEELFAELPWQTIRGRGGDRRRDGRRLSSSNGQDNEDLLADFPWQTVRGRGGERRRDGRRLSSSNNEELLADLPWQTIRGRGGERRRDGRRLSSSNRQDNEDLLADFPWQTVRGRGGGRRRDGRRLSSSNGQDNEDLLTDFPWQTVRGRGGERSRDGRRLSSSNGQDNEELLTDLPWQTIRGRGRDRRRDGRRFSSSNRQDNEQLAADLTRHSAGAGGRGRGWDVRRRSPSPIGEDYEALLALDERLGEVRQQGLSSKEIAQLPISSCKKQTNGGAAEECNICMEAYVEGQRQRRLPCFHCFHVSCIDQWLKEKASCPICRVDIHLKDLKRNTN